MFMFIVFMFCHVFALMCLYVVIFYVLLCVCLDMFLLCYVYVLLCYVLLCFCFLMLMFCYVYVCCVSAVLLFFLASGKGIQNRLYVNILVKYPNLKKWKSGRLSLCFIMLMFCYVYVLLCFCFCYGFIVSRDPGRNKE